MIIGELAFVWENLPFYNVVSAKTFADITVSAVI